MQIEGAGITYHLFGLLIVIVIFIGFRHLFWTDWGKKPKIERSTLSGTDRVTIVSTNLTWPNDLAIDFKQQRLYWVDAKLDSLQSVDFHGNNRHFHYEILFNNGIVHPYILAYSAERKTMYFSDWYTDKVYADPMMNGLNLTAVFQNRGLKRNIGQIRLLEDEKMLNGKSFKYQV